MHAKPLSFIIGLVSFLSISMWTPPVIISTHPDNISYANNWPEMAGDPLGNTCVVWQGYDGNDEEIYWVRVDAEGTPGQVQKISTHQEGESHKDQYPQIAVDSSGNSCITWYGFDGNSYDIYWVKIDPTETPGPIQKISTHPDNVTYADWNPQIAVDSSGNSHVVWQGGDGNDVDLYWVKVDASGEPGEVLKVSDHPDNVQNDDLDPQIAVDAQGNSYIVWHGCDKENCEENPGNLEIYWVKIDFEGLPGTVRKIPSTNPDNANTMAMEPQLAVDAQGNSFIVWSGVSEEDHNIYWVKVDTSGKLGTSQKIQDYPDSDYDDYNPRIAAKSGALYITWENFDENDYDVYWVMINASGLQGEVQKISNYRSSSAYDDRLPRIAVDSSGNSHIVWEKFNRKPAGQFDQRIYWVEIDTEGNLGEIRDISSHQRKHFDQIPQIAVDAEGHSYVIWLGKVESKNDLIFYTAYLSNPTLSTALTVAIPLIVIIVIIIVIIRKKFGKESVTKTSL
jgi:hypothetical protein